MLLSVVWSKQKKNNLLLFLHLTNSPPPLPESLFMLHDLVPRTVTLSNCCCFFGLRKWAVSEEVHWSSSYFSSSMFLHIVIVGDTRKWVIPIFHRRPTRTPSRSLDFFRGDFPFRRPGHHNGTTTWGCKKGKNHDPSSIYRSFKEGRREDRKGMVTSHGSMTHVHSTMHYGGFHCNIIHSLMCFSLLFSLFLS